MKPHTPHTPQMPHHTILFNIASFTLIGLSREAQNMVYEHIEDVVNGDNLYENPSKETILTAYHDMQVAESFGIDCLNWVDHISLILDELGMASAYIKKGQPAEQKA